MNYIVLAFTLAMTVLPAVAAGPSPEQQIRQLEQQLSDALNRADAAVAERIWADDYVFVSTSGRVSGKAARLASLRPTDAAAPVFAGTLDELQVRVYGATAIALVKSTWRGTIDAKAVVDRYVATHVWVRSKRGWRLASAQVAQVPAGE